ncbi:efflux RND transporter permease subunit [Azotobacter chroococcum]|uniref:Efflux pump membrane transporter n=1 Tax=Azotobacter chroococcum NCIMB 8003 TaxID=1328314 RepID=A0A0C4WU84_9GAMM|nr:efflux RND transporter permease subunit [Azotobacter chroococcum]AJE23375.1 multidrug efflux pump RND-family transporter protein [Azotobacter chroococcum NCIMB 8003]
MSRFFIDRPIFAWVIALVIMLGGALAILKLPITQYPNIAPPAIQISVTYPGASAQTVQDTVVQVIEQQLNGLDGLRYISSVSNADGSLQITVTFEQGINPDIAQVQVQNKLQLATPMLPEEVQRQGIRVVKYQVNFMLIIGLVSTDGRMTGFDMGNYIISNLQDPISRTKGVGDFQVFGSQYAMRIWLDPEKLNSYQLTPQDVVDAVGAQNVQISSGQLGGLPASKGVQLNATVIGKTRMRSADEFREILLKVNRDGSQIRLKHVAEVGLSAENFSIASRFNGMPAAGMALRLAPGANLLESVAAVRETVDNLKPYLPEGVEVVYPYETAPMVSASIEAVVHTLFEAIVLVFLVMYLFLQNFRATLIPTLAVPVVLLATFGVLFACGFTINVMTMFAMVLAIGLLVDDAIVVVENVERIMVEEGLSPKEATRKSMGQISGALVGIALVISAVFLPMAFFGGSAGVIYRQFAITIISAMSFSVLIALVFTPALCATLLKPVPQGEHHEKRGFFGWFNRTFERSADGYQRGVGGILKRRWRFMLIYLLLIGGVAFLFERLPGSFLPNEDQGTLFVQVQLPPNASAERTEAVLAEARDWLLNEEGATVASAFTVNGFNFAGRGQSSGLLFVSLKPFSERTTPAQDIFALAGRAAVRFAQIKDAMVIPVVPPAVREMGNASGFDIFLQDYAGLGHEALMAARNQFLGLAAQEPVLTMVRPNGKDDEAQYQVTIDDEKARALQVSIAEINNTMSVAWGSAYVNDFIDRGRVKRVYVQGKQDARLAPEDFDKWYVRNAEDQMVPFSAFASGQWVYGSPKLERYNGIASVEILGQPAAGYSTGDAMAAVNRIAAQLPPGIGIAYTGLSYEERAAGSQAPALYALSLLIVFLCLAALYESWSVPFSVMLVVPLGVLGAVAATLLRGLSNDVFFQVGMLTTMGLAAKNAILIVEFAKDLHEHQGRTLLQAASEAARLRLRPIIMTSIAFALGVLPLAIATGPGSGSQHSIGTGVLGGTLAATFLAIFFVPLFYVMVVRVFERKERTAETEGVTA